MSNLSSHVSARFLTRCDFIELMLSLHSALTTMCYLGVDISRDIAYEGLFSYVARGCSILQHIASLFSAYIRSCQPPRKHMTAEHNTT